MVPEPEDIYYKTAKKFSLAGLKEQLEILELREKNPNHRYHTISSYNSILYGVKNVIDKKVIDLVIMGTKGASGVKSTLFGTNTVNIMENTSACPVLAIPENVQFIPPNEIVFPTDYKSSIKRPEIKILLDISRKHRAAICILHIKVASKLSRIQENNKVLLDDLLAGVDHSFHTLSDTKVQKGINYFIRSRGSDMVAFMNKKHLFFGSILSNPLVKEMGYFSKIPVLVLKDIAFIKDN